MKTRVPTGIKDDRPNLNELRLKTIVAVYAEMLGQVARQNRNVEQVAAECAKKSIICADELIRALSAQQASADRSSA